MENIIHTTEFNKLLNNEIQAFIKLFSTKGNDYNINLSDRIADRLTDVCFEIYYGVIGEYKNQGSFVTAIKNKDFTKAFDRGDLLNQKYMYVYYIFMREFNFNLHINKHCQFYVSEQTIQDIEQTTRKT